MSEDLGYKPQADGWLKCDHCLFVSPHENKMQRHQVKSHGRDPYPAPPLMAEKWRNRDEPPSAAGSVDYSTGLSKEEAAAVVRTQAPPVKKPAVKAAPKKDKAEVKDG